VMGDNREGLIAASQRTYFRSKAERDLLWTGYKRTG
jgi:hypothetical protein